MKRQELQLTQLKLRPKIVIEDMKAWWDDSCETEQQGLVEGLIKKEEGKIGVHEKPVA